MTNASSLAKWMLVACLLVGLSVPLLLHLAFAEDSVGQDARTYWRSLDEAERQKLAENVEQFDALNPDERKRLRGLHESLEEQSKSGRPFMMAAIGFNAWLNGLPSEDAERIRQAQTDEERLALIDQLRPQRQPPNPADQPHTGDDPRDLVMQNRAKMIAALPDVMEAVRRSTPLTNPERIFVSKTPGMAQHVATLIFAHKHAAETDPDWLENWPSQEIADNVQRALEERNLGHLQMGDPAVLKVRLAGMLGTIIRETGREQQDRLKRGLLFRAGSLITPEDLDRSMRWTAENRPSKPFRRFPNRKFNP